MSARGIKAANQPLSSSRDQYEMTNMVRPKKLKLSWISAEKNIYKELTIKFLEPLSEMFIKNLFMNIGE
jgi:hypothetical protein